MFFVGSVADPDPGSGIWNLFDAVSGIEKKFRSRIRDKHPGSATLFFCRDLFVLFNIALGSAVYCGDWLSFDETLFPGETQDHLQVDG
jgi:hypothetical protein